ncbi:tripartite motif-containing protein 16-like protein [Polymixia lowei]
MNKKSCSCPECFNIFKSRPHLIKNTTLADLVTDIEGSKEGAKSEREQLHATPRPSGEPWTLKRPRASMAPGPPESNVSPKYNSKTEWVSEERRRKQEELKNIMKKYEKECDNLRGNLTQIQEGAREAEDHCEGVFTELIDSLQRHYGTVKDFIGVQEKAAAAKVQSSLRSLEEIRKRHTELHQLACADNDADFLQEWSSFTSPCKTGYFPGVAEDLLLPFEPIKRAVEEFGRQLDAICDIEITTISHTVTSISTDPGQTCDPKTRAEFLQYACELTLDPNTAHKDLVLSNENKQVNVGHQKEKHQNLPHPEQFTRRRQLLCREGLQAERCYYEIEVGGDKAEIALTYKGIDRKSLTRLSAFGGNGNSWSLDRSKVFSVSHKGEGIQLTTTPSHQRIGVYLKFKEGILSFYEVSEPMKFLYKLEATFTEPLYPGFWLGDKCCIRLCDLTQKTL